MRRLALAAWIGLAGLTIPTAPASAAEPIEGRWSMGGGIVELRAVDGGFSSFWISQRPGLLCPEIDDQDGDMRLGGSGLSYTGTWNWVSGSRDGRDCESIGRGPVVVTVSSDGRTAQLEADAPAGYSDHESHTLTRAPAGGGARPGGADRAAGIIRLRRAGRGAAPAAAALPGPRPVR